MEIVNGWRVVRMVKKAAGSEKQENLSRVFAVRDAPLICANQCGDGAFIQAVKTIVENDKESLC